MSGERKEGDETLRVAVKRRVAKEERAFRMVEKMVLDDTVDKQFFLDAGQFITVSQYKDVVEERGMTKMCGYPLCNNQLTQILKQKYKISMKEHKVYDITERKNFCSNICYKASKYYNSQLSAEPVWMRDDEKRSVELKLFNEEKDPKHRVSGSGEEIVIGTNFSQCSSCDKTQDGSKLSFKDTTEGMASDEAMNLDEQEKDCVDNDEVGHDVGVGDDHEVDHDDYSHDLGDNDTNNDDDVKNRSLSECQSSSAQKTYPVQSTSEIPGNSSPHQGTTAEKRMCQKPVGPNIGSKSEVNKATGHHRSVDTPISSWKEREGCVPKGTREDKKQKDSKDLNARLGIGNSRVGLDNSSRLGSEDSSRVDNEDASKRKDSVKVVHQTLCEWCRADTWAYFTKCSRSEAGTEEKKDLAFSLARNTNVAECDSDDDDVNEGTMKEEFETSFKTIRKKPIIPSIDSKNPMSIRGKIVSRQLTKALLPILSRLGLTFADVSYDITNILKTLRFTSTNIVLKPLQWTLVGLTLILSLMGCNTTLRALLCARQKDLHSLLNEVAISENDLDRLINVFILERDTASHEPAIESDFDQRGFNMEQLD